MTADLNENYTVSYRSTTRNSCVCVTVFHTSGKFNAGFILRLSAKIKFSRQFWEYNLTQSPPEIINALKLGTLFLEMKYAGSNWTDTTSVLSILFWLCIAPGPDEVRHFLWCSI
jgi:hypothetical protein